MLSLLPLAAGAAVCGHSANVEGLQIMVGSTGPAPNMKELRSSVLDSDVRALFGTFEIGEASQPYRLARSLTSDPHNSIGHPSVSAPAPLLAAALAAADPQVGWMMNNDPKLIVTITDRPPVLCIDECCVHGTCPVELLPTEAAAILDQLDTLWINIVLGQENEESWRSFEEAYSLSSIVPAVTVVLPSPLPISIAEAILFAACNHKRPSAPKVQDVLGDEIFDGLAILRQHLRFYDLLPPTRDAVPSPVPPTMITYPTEESEVNYGVVAAASAFIALLVGVGAVVQRSQSKKDEESSIIDFDDEWVTKANIDHPIGI